jgi:hypothetical protein
MAERQRMTAEEVVAKLMSDEHADVLRESLRWMVEQLMGGRGVGADLAPSPLCFLRRTGGRSCGA